MECNVLTFTFLEGILSSPTPRTSWAGPVTKTPCILLVGGVEVSHWFLNWFPLDTIVGTLNVLSSYPVDCQLSP